MALTKVNSNLNYDIGTRFDNHITADPDPHPGYLTPTKVVAGSNISVDRTTTPGSVIIAGQADHGTLTGLSDNDHPQYLLKSGDTMTGQLEIRNSSIYIHNPGVSHVRLKEQGGGLRVENPSDSQVLLPVAAGAPRDGNDLATVNWTRTKDENVQVSGPHGPLEQYQRIDTVIGSQTVWTQCLYHTSRVTGITRVDIQGYLQIRNVNTYSRASLSAFAFGYGRWHDGWPFSFTNNNNVHMSRLTVTKKAGTTSGDYGYSPAHVVFWFVNRPGARCTLGWAANVDAAYDGSVYADFGYMRISCTVYPNGTYDALDSPAWGTT